MTHPTLAGAPDLSVVVPVFNEAGNIAALVREIRAALAPVLRFEIVYVDDGSTDGTDAELRQAMREAPELRVIRHVGRCGQSTALRTGVHAARAPWIATLDGDGQNDPADLPALWRTMSEAGCDPRLMVAGWRRVYRSTQVRRVGSRIANAVRRWMLDDGTPDTGCTLKIMARALYLELPYFDHMHRFMGALVIRHGGRVMTVPVNHRLRTRGVSKYGMLDRLLVGIVDLFGVLWLARRTRLPERVVEIAAE